MCARSLGPLVKTRSFGMTPPKVSCSANSTAQAKTGLEWAAAGVKVGAPGIGHCVAEGNWSALTTVPQSFQNP